MAKNKNIYDKPKLREKLKNKIYKGSKYGDAYTWNARKSQFLAKEYKRSGGGYLSKPTKKQKSLVKWTKEKWRTSDGKKAKRPGGTTRYLPDKAWKKLTPAQKAATNRKKRKYSKKGVQYAPNTKAAKKASRKVRRRKNPDYEPDYENLYDLALKLYQYGEIRQAYKIATQAYGQAEDFREPDLYKYENLLNYLREDYFNVLRSKTSHPISNPSPYREPNKYLSEEQEIIIKRRLKKCVQNFKFGNITIDDVVNLGKNEDYQNLISDILNLDRDNVLENINYNRNAICNIFYGFSLKRRSGLFDDHSKKDKEETKENAEGFTYYFILGWLQSEQKELNLDSKTELYHCTKLKSLRLIIENGLLPIKRSFTPGDFENYLFLSDIEAIPNWFDYVSNVFSIPSVILKTNKFSRCLDDSEGTMDSNYPAYKCLDPIEPEYLYVWLGDDWVLIKNLIPTDFSFLRKNYMDIYNSFVERFL